MANLSSESCLTSPKHLKVIRQSWDLCCERKSHSQAKLNLLLYSLLLLDRLSNLCNNKALLTVLKLPKPATSLRHLLSLLSVSDLLL